ncbi:MAG: hypothetical protein AAFY56_16155 [Pseudomonadota bacterium]
MPRARKYLVSIADTPYYHVTSRCVRRAFLCGHDRFSGKSYEHRRDWIEARIRLLSSIFTVHIAAYAVMSNHYHLVVRLAPDEASVWSDDEVLERWCALYRGPLLVRRYRAGEALTPAENDTVRDLIAVFRRRLTNLSWFMKCLNEPIARRANREDGCTGHFWEARFKSQALRSERALLAAMAYVDLNPVRAGIAARPEEARYTSLRARLAPDTSIDAVRQTLSPFEKDRPLAAAPRLRPLQPFSDGAADRPGPTTIEALPLTFIHYVQLVDLAGRQSAHGKRGRIDPATEPILKRLGFSVDKWLIAATSFEALYRNGDVRASAA